MSAVLSQNRWWIYQQERFPVLAHGILIAAFSFSGVCLSAMLRGASTFPPAATVIVAFLVSFGFFFLLRVADEFKDFEDDARYRPYRPVPRGLIQLRELGWLGAAVMLGQLVLTAWLDVRLIALLLLAWAYWGLMCKEFFVADWLKKQHFTYMWSHMVIMPVYDLYTTACDWLLQGSGQPPPGLGWFLLVSFFNGIVLEVGRKIRQPQDEEAGVDTYSVVWGRRKAVAIWLGALLVTAGCAFMTARQIDFAAPIAFIFGGLLLLALGVTQRFFSTQESRWGKWFEHLSGIWTLLMYLCLGTVPLLLKVTGVGA